MTQRELEASSAFDMLIGSPGGHMSLLSEVREMTPFGRWEPVFLSSRGTLAFYLTTRNSPRVQLEFDSGSMDCLLERKLEYPLDLIAVEVM